MLHCFKYVCQRKTKICGWFILKFDLYWLVCVCVGGWVALTESRKRYFESKLRRQMLPVHHGLFPPWPAACCRSQSRKKTVSSGKIACEIFHLRAFACFRRQWSHRINTSHHRQSDNILTTCRVVGVRSVASGTHAGPCA